MRKREESEGGMRTHDVRLKKKTIWISTAAVAATVVVIFCAVAALRHRDSFRPGVASHFYVNGIKVEWSKDMKLTRRDGATLINDRGQTADFQGFPLVLEGEDTILLQRSSSYNRISDERIFRLDYFTRINKGEEGITVSCQGREQKVEGGFVYDNKDTYIFLEPVTLTWGENSMEVEPMTILQVTYMDYMEIYGPGVAPRAEAVLTDDVTAEFSEGKKVNLSTDRYYMQNGVWRLLFLPLEGLGELETGGAVDEEEQ